MFSIFSSSAASRAGLQRARGEEPREAGAGRCQRRHRLAGAHTGQNLSAALRAAAPRRGPQHPASTASPGHHLLRLHRHREGRGQQRESQRARP